MLRDKFVVANLALELRIHNNKLRREQFIRLLFSYCIYTTSFFIVISLFTFSLYAIIFLTIYLRIQRHFSLIFPKWFTSKTTKRDSKLPFDFQPSLTNTYANSSCRPVTWGPRELEIRLYVNHDWTVNRAAGTWQNIQSLHAHTGSLRFEFRIRFRGFRAESYLKQKKDWFKKRNTSL